VDKRERLRVQRQHLRKARSRDAAQKRGSVDRQLRAWEKLEAAQQALDARAYEEAVEYAQAAVTLVPRDSYAATLYVAAAEKSGNSRHYIASLEHLISIAPPSFPALVRLAQLHCGAGNLERAAGLATEARLIVPRRLAQRRQWLAALEGVERAVANRVALRADTPQRELPFARPLTSPAPEATRFSPASVPPTVATAESPPDESTSAAALTPAAPAPTTATSAPRRNLEIPITVAADVVGLDALSGTAASDLNEVTLALLATELRDAESFDRLLAVERAQGLLRLSHQEETVRKTLSVLLGRALLADEVGLGKTIEAGLILSEYLLRGRVRSALVLTPPSLVGQWREELAAKFDIAARTTEDAAFRSDPLRWWEEPGVIVASLPTARSERHRHAVTGRPWDLVIVDEAHTLKNHRTEAYALVQSLQSRFLLLLTATPVENRVEELYNLVSLIRPGHLGGRQAFVRSFATNNGQLTETARGEIRNLLSEIMIRNTRALSGVHLPPRFARTLLVQPGREEHALYDYLAAALRSLATTGRARLLLSTLLQEAGSSPQAVRGTLEKVAGDESLSEAVRGDLASAADFARRATGSEKTRALLQAVQGSPGATVVFTRFRGTLAFLAEALAREGVQHECLHGDIPAAARAGAIDRCRQAGSVLLSTDVGSEGLNLQFCHRLINFDLPWNPMRIEQRIGRLHRIGQEHPVEVVNFCLAGSIEERILGILDERINLFELVVGEVEMILGYLDSPREFPELVLDAFAEHDEVDRARSFARIADALAAARERYRTVKLFDEALFRNELGV